MKAATGRVCAVAEWSALVRRRRFQVASRLLQSGGGGRAASGSVVDIVDIVISMVGME
jgi:hypothetical protein